MPTRIAATISLFCFAACLMVGLVTGDNSFGTLVWRALLAMGGTFAIGLVIGKMAQVMLAEDQARQARQLEEAREKELAGYREREKVLEVGSEGVASAR